MAEVAKLKRNVEAEIRIASIPGDWNPPVPGVHRHRWPLPQVRHEPRMRIGNSRPPLVETMAQLPRRTCVWHQRGIEEPADAETRPARGHHFRLGSARRRLHDGGGAPAEPRLDRRARNDARRRAEGDPHRSDARSGRRGARLSEHRHARRRGRETWIYDKIATEASYSNSNAYGTILILGAGRSAGAASATQKTLTVLIKFGQDLKVETFSYHSSKF